MARASKLRPPSAPAAARTLDGRTWQGKLLKETRNSLVLHVGGKPTATQTQLIQRAAMLTVHVAELDRSALATGAFSDHAARQYLAWSNTLARTLARLGPAVAAQRQASLADKLAAKVRA